MNKAISRIGWFALGAMILLIMAASSPSPYTPWKAFRGTGGIVISTNPVAGTVSVDGSAITGSGIPIQNGSGNATTLSNLTVVNGFTNTGPSSFGGSITVTGAFSQLDFNAGSNNRWLIDPVVGGLNYFNTSGYLGLSGVPWLNFSANALTPQAANTIDVGTFANPMRTNWAKSFNAGTGNYAGNGSGLTNIPLAALQTNSATSGQVVGFNGTTWVPTTSAAGSTTLVTLAVGTLNATNSKLFNPKPIWTNAYMKLVFEGDSLSTNGVGVSWVNQLTNNYLNDGTTWIATNAAVAGDTCSNMWFTYTNQIQPWIVTGTTGTVVSIDGGGNDLGAGFTAEQTWSSISNIATQAKSDGAFVVVHTLVDSGNFTVAQRESRHTVNTKIRLSTNYNVLVDWDAYMPSYSADVLLTDLVHFSAQTHLVLARLEYLAYCKPTESGKVLSRQNVDADTFRGNTASLQTLTVNGTYTSYRNTVYFEKLAGSFPVIMQEDAGASTLFEFYPAANAEHFVFHAGTGNTVAGDEFMVISNSTVIVSGTNGLTCFGPLVNKSTASIPTNTARFFVTVGTLLNVTNINARGEVFLQLAFDDVTGGIPSCTVVATNMVATNNFGIISPTLSGLTLVGTVTLTNHYTYPMDTNMILRVTDTSTGGAATRLIQSILFN